MSLVQEILYIVSNYPGGYRTIYDILYDSKPPPSKSDRYNIDYTVRNTLSRLKKKGLVKNTNGKWSISEEGKDFLISKKRNIKSFFPLGNRSNKSENKLLVIFDIPEKKKRHRDWLRHELISLDFSLIQKSVWLGPPLPKEFIQYLDEIRILQYIKFFKVSEGDLI